MLFDSNEILIGRFVKLCSTNFAVVKISFNKHV